MVNENNINLIAKENYKQVEEVREIDSKYEVPSFEEFMKTYQEDEKAIDDYDSEFDSYGDIRVVKCYGPGFWEGVWDVTKKVGGFALAASYVTPIGPVTMSASLVAAGSVMAMEKYGDDDVKKAANEIKDVLRAAHESDGINGVAAEAGTTYNNYRSVTRR